MITFLSPAQLVSLSAREEACVLTPLNQRRGDTARFHLSPWGEGRGEGAI